MDDVEYERRELLDAIHSLGALIEQSRDHTEIICYVEQLNKFTKRLVALGPATSMRKARRRKSRTLKSR